MTGVQTCALPICFPVTIIRNGIHEFSWLEWVNDWEVEEIIGDLEDLENLPLLIAREDTNADGPELPNAES